MKSGAGVSIKTQKINGWNLKIHLIEKETHLPSTSILGCNMLIFQGVMLKHRLVEEMKMNRIHFDSRFLYHTTYYLDYTVL